MTRVQTSAALTVLWAVLSVVQFADGHEIVGAFTALAAVLSAWALVHERRRAQPKAQQHH